MDIVERLTAKVPQNVMNASTLTEAAATITALRARVAELEGALEPFVALGDVVLAEAPPNATRFDAFQDCRGVTHKLELDDFRRARAALRAKGGE